MLIILQKQKQKWPPLFVFATPPCSNLMEKQKQKLGHLVNLKSSEPVIMPLTEWPPWPFLPTHVACVFSTACCLWKIYFHSTAHKQSIRHIGVWIIARGLIFAEKIHITCWLFIFSLLQCCITFFFEICSPSPVYCYCWSVEGYYKFRELHRCWKGGRKGHKGGWSWHLIIKKYLPILSQVLYPSNPLQKWGVIFVVLQVFLELNIFTMQKISFCSANKLGIFWKQKQKL